MKDSMKLDKTHCGTKLLGCNATGHQRAERLSCRVPAFGAYSLGSPSESPRAG